MSEVLRISLDQPHMERLAKGPKTALAELVWNAIDADAGEIRVTVEAGALGGPFRLVVEDTGTGIAPDDRAQTFGRLGYSWKSTNKTSPAGRAIHGSKGEGRFASFGLGDLVKWTSVANSTADGRVRFTITSSKAQSTEFQVSDVQAAADAPTGVTVEVSNLGPKAVKYLEGTVAHDLLTTFALQLEQYGISVYFNDDRLDVNALKKAQTDLPLQVEGLDDPVTLTIIEWNTQIARRLYLCDAEGITLHERAPGIHAPGHQFTAYLRWKGFADQQSFLELDSDDGLEPPEPIPSIISAAQDAMREHFKALDEAKSAKLIKQWTEEGTYPYKELPKSRAEEAARGLFDIVAVAAASAVERAQTEDRKVSLGLIRAVVETDPTPAALRHVLTEVLNLPPQEVEELSEVIGKTSLTSVVRASKQIVGRLDFLIGLEEIVSDPELKKHVRERSQLHKIVASETWIFREEYALTANDNTLKTALQQHIGILGRDELVPDETVAPVLDSEGKERVVDLMLSGAIEQAKNVREHLVIELKRPTVSIGEEQLRQIKNYALALASDSRFAKVNTEWEFWIVGDKIDPVIEVELGQGNLPRDVASRYEKDGHFVTVRAVTWAQVIQNARHRLKFVGSQLDYDPTVEEGLAYLRKVHGERLPTVLMPAAPAAEPGPAA